MANIHWFILIVLGAAMMYVPRLNITFSISLGLVLLILGIFGLIRGLFK